MAPASNGEKTAAGGSTDHADPLGLLPEELAVRVAVWGWPRYRANQMFGALQRRRAASWEDASGLPLAARRQLGAAMPFAWPAVVNRFAAADGTVRYLLRLQDGETVEAVFLPDEIFDGPRGPDWGARGPRSGPRASGTRGAAALGPAPVNAGRTLRRRTTFCLSTQAGCPVNCQFCLTAKLGLRRNLTAGEIAGQALRLMHEHGLAPGAGGERLNLVYMGMGEPFLNYAAVMQSVRILTHPQGVGLPSRRITISTSGIVDKIRRFGAEPNRPRLAISLNATTDELRQELMPLHQAQGGLAALTAAARAFPLGPRERLTWEYVLLAGINDRPADADRLATLSRGLRAKVNLIAWNAGPDIGFAPPTPETVLAFQRRLTATGLPAYIRRPRGREVYAACGQLSFRMEAAPH